jgi:hypothetical protein
MKRLLLGTASTAACLVVLAGVAYADPPVFHNVPANTTVSAGANDKAVITFTHPIFVTDDDNDTYDLHSEQWFDTKSVEQPAHCRHLHARGDHSHLQCPG